MEISVVVPTFNRRKIVTRTVEALFAQNPVAAAYEIIVVVDGSADGTAAALRLLRPTCPFRVIEQENRGPSAARNAGYRAATANLVLFLDDDMLADPGLVAAHVAAHKSRGGIVAFGSLYLSSDSPPSLATECFNREIGAFYLERKRNPRREWQVADCVFSNASMPRALLNEVGGFDETFRKREDLELGVRLLDSGVQQLYVDDAVAYQYFEKTSADLIHDAEAFALGDVKFAHKHPSAIIKGQLNWLDKEPALKRRILQMAATVPLVADLFLYPICTFAEIFSHMPVLRDMGVRALQIRRRIRWYHKVLELGWCKHSVGAESP
jgi:glycosyltransferase involved in cell wall biosynthesis